MESIMLIAKQAGFSNWLLLDYLLNTFSGIFQW